MTNDFDRAARYAVKEWPAETIGWLFPRLRASVSYHRWLDSQSAPRPGESDRRCDTIAELIDNEGLITPWACVVELFTEADADAIDRALEYVGRFRRELRHGPYGHDRYPFAVALVFLTGASRETRLDMNLSGMEEVGLWFGPRVLDLSEEDAVAHMDAIEENRRGSGLLVWTPLMKGGQSKEAAVRWRSLAEQDSRLPSMVDVAIEFARLTDCQGTWREALEGLMMKVSPYAEEIRQEGRIEMARKHTLVVLEGRFPGRVPAAIVERIKAETNLAELENWLKFAISESLEEFQQRLE